MFSQFRNLCVVAAFITVAIVFAAVREHINQLFVLTLTCLVMEKEGFRSYQSMVDRVSEFKPTTNYAEKSISSHHQGLEDINGMECDSDEFEVRPLRDISVIDKMPMTTPRASRGCLIETALTFTTPTTLERTSVPSTLSPTTAEFDRAITVAGPGPPIMTGTKVKGKSNSINLIEFRILVFCRQSYNILSFVFINTGPEGANLFCFHLPNDLTNWDLYLLFRKYGNILSVHIMVNKETGLSRGFGFVSFENRADAEEACTAMNGFRLGSKRLKVQQKRAINDTGENIDSLATSVNVAYASSAFRSNQTFSEKTRKKSSHNDFDSKDTWR